MTSVVNDNFRPRTRTGFPMDRYGPVASKKKRSPPLFAMVTRSTALVRRIAGKIQYYRSMILLYPWAVWRSNKRRAVWGKSNYLQTVIILSSRACHAPIVRSRYAVCVEITVWRDCNWCCDVRVSRVRISKLSHFPNFLRKRLYFIYYCIAMKLYRTITRVCKNFPLCTMYSIYLKVGSIMCIINIR